MYDKSFINDLLNKANITDNDSLKTFTYKTFDNFSQAVGEKLNHTEKKMLYMSITEKKQESSAFKRKNLARKNPQLRQANSLSIVPLEEKNLYHFSPSTADNQIIEDENYKQYVPTGHVGSMFSPSAYLSELYREAIKLHNENNENSLKKRRPDLASLTLTQGNLDKEVSTLSLSNKILLQGCQSQENELNSKEKVLAHLSNHRLSGSTPYNYAFQTLRHSIQKRKMNPEDILAVYEEINPENIALAENNVGIFANIDPELYLLLTEEITEKNVSELFNKNFGAECAESLSFTQESNKNASIFLQKTDLCRWLLDTHNLAKYYDVPVETVEKLLSNTTAKANNIDLYVDGNYTQVIQSGTKLSVVQIVRKPGSNYSSQLYYANLIPSENKYCLKIKPYSNIWHEQALSELHIYQSNGNNEVEKYVDAHYGAATEKEIVVDNLDIKDGTRFYLRRTMSPHYTNAGVDFNVTEITDVRTFLLKLNKLLRLSKATDLSPTEINRIILANNTEINVNHSVIASLVGVVRYKQRYNLSTEEAVILCGASLSQYTLGETRSQFDLLFNQVSSSENTLAPNDELEINLHPDNNDNQDWKSALKQAFQVNDTELLAMADSEKLKITLANLSYLYFIQLLGRIHHLTVSQTLNLLNILGYTIKEDTAIPRNTIVENVYHTAQWLKDEALTVEQLFLMTTKKYLSLSTPEMVTLIEAIKINVEKKDKNKNARTAISPLLGSALGINNINVSENILNWLDTLKTNDQIDCKNFIDEVIKLEIVIPAEKTKLTERVIDFCYRAAQLGLIVKALKLGEPETKLIAQYPKKILGDKFNVVPLTITALKQLTTLRDILTRCGSSSPQLLDELINEKLTPTLLANAIGEEEQALILSWQCLQENVLKKSTLEEKTFIHDIVSINLLLKTLNLAKILHVSPSVIKSFLKINNVSDYATLQSIANKFLAGLDESNRQQIHNTLDEELSAALSQYYIHHVLPNKKITSVETRDDLFDYLLIDNQISSAVKTSKIASAIASIQLYIDNCLQRIEKDVLTENILDNSFFDNWEQINKRYSQWAALKHLLYYPENYIDPTQRIGQTKMMNCLLQSVSQGELNNDTVEDAVKTYLTNFEHISNLSVIGGYHDGINIHTGLTYFVGRSQTAPTEYYWRSVDQGMRDEDGIFPASAWREWQKIDTALQPVGKLIRPVIFNERLYIISLERQEKSEQKENQKSTYFDYTVKLTHTLHDGTWAAPLSFPFPMGKNEDLKQYEKSINELSLYCGNWVNQETLIIFIYKKYENDNKINYEEFKAQGILIDNEMNHKEIDKKAFQSHFNNIKNELSTSTHTKITNKYTLKYSAEKQLLGIDESSNWGLYFLSKVYGGSISSIMTTEKTDPLKAKITLTPRIKITHDVSGDNISREKCNLMKKYGQLGDKFLIFNQIDKNNDNSNSDANVVPIFQYKGNKSNNQEGRFLFYTNVSAKTVDVWLPGKRSLPTVSISENYKFIKDNVNNVDDYKSYFFMILNEINDIKDRRYAIDIRNPIEIDTTIDPSDVTVTIDIGKGKNNPVFTAKEYCSSLPTPNFIEMIYQFNSITFELPDNVFVKDYFEIPITFTARAKDNRILGNEKFILTITRKISDTLNFMSIKSSTEGAEYLESGVYRTRLNTLFAKKLIAKANKGLNAIYNMETQNLPEPKLGEGTYITLTLKKYDHEIHGSDKKFNLLFCNVFKWEDEYHISSGELSENTSKTIKIFLPSLEDAYGNRDNLYLTAKYQKGKMLEIRFKRSDTHNPNGWELDKTYNDGIFEGLESVSGLGDSNEIMDFTGSNALYFWELFYYLPILVTQRLLQQQRFNEAVRWLKYIYSPSGYLNNHNNWNVRPLLENTGWNKDPINTTDPDAVAQHDPFHYKLATFMTQLDLFIARGDAAYRLLERDTLVEAMMWYRQALNLLGPKYNSQKKINWHTPTLSELEKKVTLEDVFLPEENAKLNDYWQTLRQRIYNLRHNLTLDGQPLFLPLYTKPAEPKSLQGALVASDSGEYSTLPNLTSPPYRFNFMLERARNLVNQLIQFGGQLNNIIERQDGEALNQLFQNQGLALSKLSIAMQNQNIEELLAEKIVLEEQKKGAQQRFEHYQGLYKENINVLESVAIGTRIIASGVANTATALHMAGAAADLLPNIFGFSDGGSRWGALFNASAIGVSIGSSVANATAENTNQFASYARRREDWDILQKNAQTEVNQWDAQIKAHAIRHEAAVMQKNYLETQQMQNQAQLEFLQRKFCNQTLYSWLRGRLSAIYYQYYDITLSRCLMVEAAYNYERQNKNQAPKFIKPVAWQSAHAGLLCGEALMLNLAQIEDNYFKWESRSLEIARTVCLSEFYKNLTENKFNLAEKIIEFVNNGQGETGNGENTLKFKENQLQATFKLSDLKMNDDYPVNLGKTRCIKQISVTLPALVGPYQDIRAVLSYGGSLTLPRGCRSLAVSHGMNDSGQFQLDFNDSKFLQFEGIPIEDNGVFTLIFPQANEKQKALLLSLSDIILHIRYTIRD